MKCPKCGFITDWDSLQCLCGYDGERQTRILSEPVAVSKAEVPLERALPHSGIGTAMKAVWIICVIGFAACALVCLLVLFLFATIAGSIGTNDGPHYAPFLLLIALPIRSEERRVGKEG